MADFLAVLIHLFLGRLAGRVWWREKLLSPGTVLHNRYVISSVHEQGRENVVYLAYDRSLNLNVAIKENSFADHVHRRQFELEATILASVRHPHIPRELDYFVEADFQFIVMDFIEGINLQQVMQRRKPGTEEVLDWAAQLCDTLAYLHSCIPSIIHRDVEPSNIILGTDDRVFLVDFGFAKVYIAEGAAHRPASTPNAWLTDPREPDLAVPAVTDSRTDQYSLAATLYALLTGAPPRDSRERLAGKPELARLRPARPDMSPYTEQAILRALSLHPDRRFQDMQEFKAALGC